MYYDHSRPYSEPARTLYDAFLAETKLRSSRTSDEWVRLEPIAVYNAAIRYAADFGLRSPTMAEVLAAERSARGSADYGFKWAFALAEKMLPVPVNGKPTLDEQMGMAWWNSLSDADRMKWATEAGTGVVADAWSLFRETARLSR
ncbi:hypothetical protein [Acidovorax sp.]|uniref:hypothetical protein n=1 Tax=Acidovorax sp. TaxID=1872122 RepID=UPI00391FCA12